MEDFADICEEVFTIDKKTGKAKGFPDGCANCQSTNEWDCMHEDYVCPWRENYWKYDELRSMLILRRAGQGGLDLNRLSSLSFLDFIKLNILKNFTQA